MILASAIHLTTPVQHLYSTSFCDYHHISGDVNIKFYQDSFRHYFYREKKWGKCLASIKTANLADQIFVDKKQLHGSSFCNIFWYFC